MAYAGDALIAQDTKFVAWIADLEAVIKAWADKYTNGELPYDLPLADGTGLECWHVMYADGYSPSDAFNEDRSYWE